MDVMTCEWPVDKNCLPDVPEEQQEQMDAAVSTSREILWALTGRRFGVCPRTLVFQPGRSGKCSPDGGGTVELYLPPPVQDIMEVQDGEGDTLWWQQTPYGLTVEATVTPVAVTYRQGVPIPQSAGQMVARLAAQRFFQCIGDTNRCELPENTTSINRQGVTVTMEPAGAMVDRGLTGLPDVDAWIGAHNPHRLTEPSAVIG